MDTGTTADWVSAIATLLATTAALLLPFIMQSIDRKKVEADRKATVTQIWTTIERAMVSYLEIRMAAEAGNPNPNPTRARQVGVECEATHDALQKMLSQSQLDGDLLVAGAAAVSVCAGTAEAALQLADDQFFAAYDIVTRHHHLAQLANSRNEVVRKRFGIERDTTQKLPVI